MIHPARPWATEVPAAVLVVAAAVAVRAAGPTDPVSAQWAVAALVLGAAFVAAGAVVRRGGVGLPAILMTVLGGCLLASSVVTAGAGRLPVLAVLAPHVTALTLAVAAPATVLAYPTGRLADPTERRAAALTGLAGAAVVAVPSGPVAVAGTITVIVALTGALWLRFERSRDEGRRRILWLVYGVGTVGIVDGHLWFAAEDLPPALLLATTTVIMLLALVLPAAMAVGLVAPDVTDVRRAISGTVLTVIMIDLVLAVYTGSLALVEALTGAPASRLVASLVCVVAAVAFHPVRRRVAETMDQVLFGGRPDPVDVVTSLGGELRRGGGPQNWLDTLCLAVDLPYAELRHRGEALAVSGDRDGRATSTVGLWAGSDHVGDLVVGLPEHHSELPRATAAVLELAAAPLARALQSARLAEELQASRQRVVVASEEERRRLRRDLHDGLGPVLSGVAYTADAARNVLADRPQDASQLLSELRDDVSGAIAEVRRLVHDLRPAALDQLGLVPALRQQADRLHRADGEPLTVTIDADDVPPLPAAVEVVAYRLVTEALLNVARHAASPTASVRVGVHDGALELCVRDAGRATTAWAPGVGLTSMRERVDQLGGDLEAGARAEGGFVRAVVPL